MDFADFQGFAKNGKIGFQVHCLTVRL